MKQLPMLGIPYVRRIIPFFFPDHLDVKALQQLQHFLSGVVRPIRDRRPGISFPKKLPGEPAAWTNRRDDPAPEPRKMPRLAKRQRKARVHQIAWGDFHLRKVHLDSRQPRLPCFWNPRPQVRERVGVAVCGHHLPTPFEQFKRVPPFARGYIDRDAPGESLVRKQIQGPDQRLARSFPKTAPKYPGQSSSSE